MLMLLSSLAVAESDSWKVYAKSAAVTAATMPVVYGGAYLLTNGSNRLVLGLLPPVLFGITAPSSAAYFSGKYFAKQQGYVINRPGLVYGGTVALNTGLYASGTALKISSDQWQDVLLYSIVNAALLPLPTWLSLKESDMSASLQAIPQDGSWIVSGGLNGSF